MVSFVSSRRTLCGRILSVPSRSSSLMDVDFSNVNYMQTGSVVVLVMAYRQAKHTCKQVPLWSWSWHTGRQTIILFRDLAHPCGPRCHRGCGISCLASSVRIGLWSSCQNNCLRSCSALLNIHHSLLLRARHDSKWSCFSSLGSIQVVMYCRGVFKVSRVRD